MQTSELADWLRQRTAGSKRYLLGICGPPGSGKSTMAHALADGFGAPVVPMDGFHLSNPELDALGLRSRKGAPETFDAHGFVSLVADLRRGRHDVQVPVFDRSRDAVRTDGVRVARDERLVIVEGNYLLLDVPPWTRLGPLLDAIVYLDVPADELERRLVARHQQHGRSRADAVAFVARSDLANADRVRSGRWRADAIVTNH